MGEEGREVSINVEKGKPVRSVFVRPVKGAEGRYTLYLATPQRRRRRGGRSFRAVPIGRVTETRDEEGGITAEMELHSYAPELLERKGMTTDQIHRDITTQLKDKV